MTNTALSRILFWETVGAPIASALFSRKPLDMRSAYRDLIDDAANITNRLAQIFGSDTLPDSQARRARVMIMTYVAEQLADHYRQTGERPAQDLVDHIHETATMVMEFETPEIGEHDVDTILRRRIASATAMQPIVAAVTAHPILGAEPSGVFARLQIEADDILHQTPGATNRDRDAVLLGLARLYANSYQAIASDGMLSGPAALQEIDRLFHERAEFVRAAAAPLRGPIVTSSFEPS